jgi:hypothetical protein
MAVLWAVLGSLLLSLIGVAVFLLFKMDFFSRNELTDEQAKAVWTFVGVALGAVVTLIGTLLAAQHNRRTAALEREAEKRLTLDTVARLLELLTDDGKYAKRARVGGAIATMVQLEGGTVALRVLGDLWGEDAIDTGTAIWLLERVLNENRPGDEHALASELLATNAAKLVPQRDDPEQGWSAWPKLPEPWPSKLSSETRNGLLVFAVKVLLARELAYWHAESGGLEPLIMLSRALDDEEFREPAAQIFITLLDGGVLAGFGIDELDASKVEQMRQWAASYEPPAWFAQLLSQLPLWADGAEVHVSHPTPPAAVGTPPRQTDRPV